MASDSQSTTMASVTTVTSKPLNIDVSKIKTEPGITKVVPARQITGTLLNTQSVKCITSSGGQVITKVIIANNAGQTLSTVPLTGVASSSTASIIASQPIFLSSPGKALAISKSFADVQQASNNITGSPAKQAIYLSPVKPSQKTILPASFIKSPRRIAPATQPPLVMTSKIAIMATPSTVTSVPKVLLQQSPTKVILKPVSSQAVKTSVNCITPAVSAANITSLMASQSGTTVSSSDTSQSSGKFHYVRLVSNPVATSNAATSAEKTVVPVMSSPNILPILPTPMTTTTTIKTEKGVLNASITSTVTQKPIVKSTVAQKILISSPAVTIPGANVASGINRFSTGTIIPIGGSAQGYVVVPANYVAQIQQSDSSVKNASVVIQNIPQANILPATLSTTTTPAADGSYMPVVTTTPDTVTFSSTTPRMETCDMSSMNGSIPSESCDSRPRKPCNCTKSQCLKLYCDCFASGEFCHTCNCNNCYNNLAHEEERQKAIKACLDRNPMAFHPKIGKHQEGDQERRHTKGCNCKRSGCLKNYCECYEAKILCTNLCKCIGCKNFEDSSERKALMHLADAAEVRAQQQALAKTNLTSQMLDVSKMFLDPDMHVYLPISLVTDDVVDATIACLLAQARRFEKMGKTEEETQKILLQEFGCCLQNIISFSSQMADTESDNPSNDES